MEDSRKRVNREAILLVTAIGGDFIKHTQFDGKDLTLFHDDGVHLSKKGNNLLLVNFESYHIVT